MKFKTEQVTPEMAAEWLKRNVVNRNIAMSRVNAYAEDMRSGNWQLNGEPIVFNESGELKDGQHRLMAVVKSGKMVAMAVVYDVSNDVSLYDRGRNRSASDALKISGIYSNRGTVSIARTYFLVNGNSDSVVAESKIREFHLTHADSLRVIARIAMNGRRKYTVNVRAASFLTALLIAYESGVKEDVLARFVSVVGSGFYNNASEMAAVVIRNDIIKGFVPFKTMVEKKESCFRVQNAIKDFAEGRERKKTYKNSINPVYGGKG